MSVELVNKGDIIDLDKENLLKKIENIDKKILDASKFIVTQEFNRLTKINSNVRMAKALKKLATHKEVENALDLRDEKREKIKKTSNI